MSLVVSRVKYLRIVALHCNSREVNVESEYVDAGI